MPHEVMQLISLWVYSLWMVIKLTDHGIHVCLLLRTCWFFEIFWSVLIDQVLSVLVICSVNKWHQYLVVNAPTVSTPCRRLFRNDFGKTSGWLFDRVEHHFRSNCSRHEPTCVSRSQCYWSSVQAIPFVQLPWRLPSFQSIWSMAFAICCPHQALKIACSWFRKY